MPKFHLVNERDLDKIRPFLPFLLFLFANVLLSLQSWEGIRNNFGWMRFTPNADSFKLRHILQFSPMTFFLLYAARKIWGELSGQQVLSLVGVASAIVICCESLQLLAPQRVFSVHDIFSNAIAVAIGYGLYRIYLLKAQKKHGLSLAADEDLPVYLFLVGLFLFNRLSVITAPIFTNGYSLMAATRNPLAGTFDYWLHIFTSPTYGPQYRPISFNAIFYWGQKLFGESGTPYKVMGMILFIASLLLLYRILKELAGDWRIPTLLLTFFACHPSTHYLLSELSHIEKYFMPFFEFSLGCYLILKNRHQKNTHLALLVLLSTLGIMSHEGAFVFPFFLVLFDIFLKRQLSWRHLVLFSPSLVYLGFRFLHFGVPSDGFMKVNYHSLLELVPRYFHIMLFPPQSFLSENWLISPFRNGGYFAFALISTASFLVLGIRAKREWGLFVGLLAILAPFAVLENHFIRTREFWAVGALTIFLTTVLKKSTGLWLAKAGKFTIVLILATNVLTSLIYQDKFNRFLSEKKKGQEELITTIRQQLVSEGDEKPYYVIKAQNQRYDSFTEILPAFLAYHFPQEEFLLKFHETDLAYVVGATFYRKKNSDDNWLDLFNYPVPANIKVDSRKPHQLLSLKDEQIDFTR